MSHIKAENTITVNCIHTNARFCSHLHPETPAAGISNASSKPTALHEPLRLHGTAFECITTTRYKEQGKSTRARREKTQKRASRDYPVADTRATCPHTEIAAPTPYHPALGPPEPRGACPESPVPRRPARTVDREGEASVPRDSATNARHRVVTKNSHLHHVNPLANPTGGHSHSYLRTPPRRRRRCRNA